MTRCPRCDAHPFRVLLSPARWPWQLRPVFCGDCRARVGLARSRWRGGTVISWQPELSTLDPQLAQVLGIK